MPGGGAGGFLRVLPIIRPGIAMQVVSPGAARHELPDSASSGTRNRIRMEARFGLRQIDEILRNAFFPERALDHLPIASATSETALQRAVAASRKIINVARHLI